MLDGPLITAEKFIETRFQLSECGQWSELEAGQVKEWQLPDLDHGTSILNLSKVLAEFFQKTRRGYACFDLGLLMERGPDTIRFPAVSVFMSQERFVESDKDFTESIPHLVVEMSSSEDRRERIPRRTEDYLSWGVQAVWIIDPAEQFLMTVIADGSSQTFQGEDIIIPPDWLNEFDCRAEELFREPSWWTGSSQ